MSDAEKKDAWATVGSRAAIFLSTIALVGSGAGCVSASDAIAFVAKSASCPPEKITAVERSDVNAVDYAATFLGAPIAEVAADPQRFAYWKQNETRQWQSLMSGRKVFEIRGCTIHNLVACRNESTDGNSILDCNWLDKPLAVQRGQLVQ